MQNLNFPQYEFKIRKDAAKVEIFDIIRKKYVVLYPEEWVRQHVVHYLLSALKYPKSLIKVESGLSYNKLMKRSDVLIYNSQGQPHLLVECKSFKQPINQATLDQATTYNKKLMAQYVLLTNGLNHYCCELIDGKEYRFVDQVPEHQKE